MIQMAPQDRTGAVDHKRGLATISVAIGALLTLGACSSGGDDPAATPSPLESVTPAAASPAPQAASRVAASSATRRDTSVRECMGIGLQRDPRRNFEPSIGILR